MKTNDTKSSNVKKHLSRTWPTLFDQEDKKTAERDKEEKNEETEREMKKKHFMNFMDIKR